jgi:DNA-binding transcriptional ArsR family regulator
MTIILHRDVQELAERHAALCRILGNPQRILILWLLMGHERTVTSIAETIGASLPNTSQHLHLMELSDLVCSRREKQNIFYRLAPNELLEKCLVSLDRPDEPLLEPVPDASNQARSIKGVIHDNP